MYNPYPTRGQQPSTYEVNYPPSATPAPSSDFTYRHQRTDSSSTTSPYASPRNEPPAYGSSAATSTYSSHYNYPSGSLPIVSSRPAQLAQSPPTVRSQPLIDQTPTAAPATYTRTSAPEEGVLGYSKQTPRFYPTNAQHPPDSRPGLGGPLLDSFSSGGQYAARPNFPNLLPPLESTVTPGQSRNATLPGYSHNAALAAGGSLISMAGQSLPEVEADHHGQHALNYAPSLYRRREDA